MDSVSKQYLDHINISKSISDNIPKQKSYVLKDVFPEIGSDRDLLKKYDSDAILGNIINILYIPKRSYPFDPEFGLELHKYIFEYNDTVTAEIVSKSITDYIVKNEPRGMVKVTHEIDRDKKKLILGINVQGKTNTSYSVTEIPYEYIYNTDIQESS